MTAEEPRQFVTVDPETSLFPAPTLDALTRIVRDDLETDPIDSPDLPDLTLLFENGLI